MFENYEYLKRIAYHQNLSVAAEELYVSQPALSKYLNRLEEKIGVCLVDRDDKAFEGDGGREDFSILCRRV